MTFTTIITCITDFVSLQGIAMVSTPIIAYFAILWIQNRLKQKPNNEEKKFATHGAITITIALVSFFIAVNQLGQINEEVKANTLNKMNEWYNNLYKEFPETFSSSDELKKRNLARRYFNLWQNELYHCTTGTIPPEFMDTINHGACKNLSLYDDLVQQFDWWVANGAFITDVALKKQIATIIVYTQKNNAGLDRCNEIPKSKNCFVPIEIIN